MRAEDNGVWKKRYYDKKKINGGLKKERDDLKKYREVFAKMVKLRQVFSNYRMTPSTKIMDGGMKEEVLKLKVAKREQIDRIIAKVVFTRIPLLMLFPRANMAPLLSFCCCHWRSHNRLPTFSNDSANSKRWEQNFVPKILEKRLRILRVVAKNWNLKLEIFRVIKLVPDLN